jgi:phosphate transport system permease protein
METELVLSDDDIKRLEAIYSQRLRVKDKGIKTTLFIFASIATVIVFLIILFLFTLGGEFFFKYPATDFFFDTSWRGQDNRFGAAYIIWGTILVAIGALVIAIPLGIAAAIFIAEIAPRRLKSILKGAVEILAGIPSVVYGYFGRTILKEWIETAFNVSIGLTWLNASFLLGIMALPTIVSVCEDAISAVPRHYREASLAMGATKWQTIRQVVLPASMSGITAAVILGMGRAIGETMTVAMVSGGNIVLPLPITDVFSGIRTITGTIVLELKEATGLHVQAIFALAIVLFMITLVINSLATIILSRINRKFTGKSKKKKPHKFTGLLSRDEGYTYFKSFYKKNKKTLKRSLYFLFLFWILSTWIPLLYALIIIGGLYGVIFMVKKIPPKRKQIFAYFLIISGSFFVLLFLGIIISYIVFGGLPKLLEPGFLTTFSQADKGGILDVLLGTLMLTGGTVLFAVPIGVLAGIYLSEYAKESRVTKIIRSGIDNLNGTPSIVFGLFGFTFLVVPMGTFSLIAGQITLALMILPTIIRTTEEALKAVPQSFREGSLALGSSKWQSISKIVIPAAAPAIVTGVILGMGRAAGETAPIIFTAAVFVRDGLPKSLFEPVMALTFHLYVLVITYPNADAQAGGTALVLLLVVLLMYGLAFAIRFYYNRKKKW